MENKSSAAQDVCKPPPIAPTKSATGSMTRFQLKFEKNKVATGNSERSVALRETTPLRTRNMLPDQVKVCFGVAFNCMKHFYHFSHPKLESFARYFGPGIILMSIVIFVIAFASPVFIHGRENHRLDRLEAQTAPEEIYCKENFENARLDYYAFQAEEKVSPQVHCSLKEHECKESMKLLEEEIKILRFRFNEKMAAKNKTIRKLVHAVTKFRLDRCCIHKSTYYLISTVFVLMLVMYIIYFSQYIRVG